MAIAAINPVIADMVFVAEWNRLVTHNIHIRDERSRVDFIGRPYSSTHQQQRCSDADSRQAIRAAVKDLCHTQPSQSRCYFPARADVRSNSGLNPSLR